MKLSNIYNWFLDYLYYAKARLFAFLSPPQHYLGHIVAGKKPVVIISGLHTNWTFLKPIADAISWQGHPVYIVERLGYNLKAVDHAAVVVKKLIEENNLHDVVIVAHSKGGLIAKYLLDFDNEDERIKKIIAIASPFGGSKLASLFPDRAYKELAPDSPMIAKLNTENSANGKIVSIFGKIDNHIWPIESCRLEGAKNIQIDLYGHHRILFDQRTRDLVLGEIDNI